MKFSCFLLLWLFAASVYGFDAIALDAAVSRFLNRWYAACDDIRHSFIYAVRVDKAYEMGFYRTHPSDFRLPEAMTDVLVTFEFETESCNMKDGYSITFRPEEDYAVVGYVSFSHPPE